LSANFPRENASADTLPLADRIVCADNFSHPKGELVAQMLKILIADDHAILRAGLKEILVRNLKEVACGEAKNAQEVLSQVRTNPWDLVILDITMPGRSGLDILSDLKNLRPHLPVLMLSMHSEDHYGKRALKAGAFGYLQKESAPEELIQAVRKVLAGGRYVSSTLADRLLADLSKDEVKTPHDSLSPREFEIFRMIGSGKPVSRIAKELRLSITTVSTHRARILEKLQLTTTADLVRYALRSKLVE
jgi:two-component system, NarL family, invasion response regulator UvrY